MARPYTGNKDAVHSAERPGTKVFVTLMCKHFGLKNLGIFSDRGMRSNPAIKSVHATWRAVDLQFPNKKVAREVIAFLEKNADALGIEEIHDYAGNSKPGTEKWGRGWRCNRNGKPGWKDWTATDNGGTPGAGWIHAEVSPAMADDAEKMKAALKAAFAAQTPPATPPAA